MLFVIYIEIWGDLLCNIIMASTQMIQHVQFWFLNQCLQNNNILHRWEGADLKEDISTVLD